MTEPEFARPRRLDTIGAGETTVEIAAEPDERAALAKRFGVVAIDRLTATFALRRDAVGVRADGRIAAAVVQACTVTGDPLPTTIDEAVALRFLPAAEAGGDEIELDEGDLDTMFFDGGAIDLGEAAAETLALALDPFPRSPGAAAVLREAGVLTEDEAAPKGALAGLKDLLKRD